MLPIALYRLIVMVLDPAEEHSAAEVDKLEVACNEKLSEGGSSV